jgi:parallel beta-helix repeat protein
MPIADSMMLRGGKMVRRLGLRVEQTGFLAVTIAPLRCLSAMLGLLASSSSDAGDSTTQEGPVSDDRIPMRSLALTQHDPIYIDGNGGFTNASGVVWGSGTESDPYVIEDLDINASTANGIEIQNTDAHFIVRSCYVHDGAWNNGTRYGIYLRYCLNGTLDGNNCTNDAQGIYLDHSSNNILTNNACSDSEAGLVIQFSSGNTVTNNSCSNNRDGIFHDHSDSNTLSNNTCNSNSCDGIYFQSSNGVTGKDRSSF